MNCVNGIGWPVNPPSNCGVTIVVTGCSLTSPTFSLNLPFKYRFTNLWSTDTVGQISSIMPFSKVLFSGTVTTWPLTVSILTPVTNDCVSPTWMTAVWPFIAMTFGEVMTLARQSPWTASSSMWSWQSVRNVTFVGSQFASFGQAGH